MIFGALSLTCKNEEMAEESNKCLDMCLLDHILISAIAVKFFLRIFSGDWYNNNLRILPWYGIDAGRIVAH
jgi:hypothetical protein